MSDHAFINEYLSTYYDELSPREFYRCIFPLGELAKTGELVKGKYNGVAVELLPSSDNGRNARRYVVTDDLSILDTLLESENFIIMSPISYIGKSRRSENARFIYAIAIDLDGIASINNLKDLFHQISIGFLPKPTYVVSSGTGLHLYYQLEKPIPCFENITKQLQTLKNALTNKIWNMYVTTLSNKPQIQSLFQGFRLCGGVTKNNERTRSFLIGKKVSIDYLNNFIDEKSRVTEFTYKSDLTLKEAKKMYPKWYEDRIVHNKPRGTWECKEDLYNWWLNRLKNEIKEGHRYYGLMCLSIYAKKCGIERARLERDAFGLLEYLDCLTTTETNHFTREDIFASLELYNDNYITFPINSIIQLTNLDIKKNKRNFRDQKDHLARARLLQDYDYPNREWSYKGGRKKGSNIKGKKVIKWKKEHPTGTVSECVKDTGVSKRTVYRYWNQENEDHEWTNIQSNKYQN